REHLLTFVVPNKAGETPLDYAAASVARGGRATLVVLLDKQTRQDFRRFADAEDLDRPAGEAIARDRLIDLYSARVGGADTETVLTDGIDSRDLARTAEAAHATGIVIPQSLAARSDLRTFVSGAQVPVLIAPAA
ncbi:hypothetical protein, partial [Ilumatobacter sp.]|uniref:hypothetical protein n=1 Tax=Ilumatobacter sp. TaxID=1967498 RepID=UPI003C390C07